VRLRALAVGFASTLMYQWIVFIHIASVMGLLLVHPVTIAFHLKEECNDTRIGELLEVSGILAVTGTGGLLLILYHMLFKPTL
jgi:hypothetical protein